MITKVSNNIQRAKSKSHVGLLNLFKVLRVYLLHKRMPNSNKCIQLCTKSIIKLSKGAKIRNRYNQVPHLTQDTNGKVTYSQ